MGSASCKNTKPIEPTQKKPDTKQITIGVLGLDNAGKTSTVKALEGAPTKKVTATISSNTSMVPYPTTTKSDNKSQERIRIIDLSGAEKFREKSWPDYYDQMHGFIFVLDASEKKRMNENKYTLQDLLDNDKLRNKPILILANKQDCKDAIDDEDYIKDKLQIEKLKTKHKIEFCTALPTKTKKVDESIRDGFAWLIQTIESNYTELNSRVNSTKSSNAPKPVERKSQMNNKGKNARSDQSDNDDDVVYAGKRPNSPPSSRKPTDHRPIYPPIRLPNLDSNKTKKTTSGHETYSENDDDDDDDIVRSHSRPHLPMSDFDRNDRSRSLPPVNASATSGFQKKKKLIGAPTNNSDVTNKKNSTNEPKSFRSTYEPFPEEVPWSSSSSARITKSDANILPKPYMKPSITNDSIKRSMSPLVNDAKQFNSGSLLKRNTANDDDLRQKSPYSSLNRYNDNENQISSTASRPLSSAYKKPISTIYGSDDDDNSNDKRLNSQRSTDHFKLNSDYRGTTTKQSSSSPLITSSRSKTNDNDFALTSTSLSKPFNRTNVNNNNYPSTYSKPKTTSTFDDDDDDDRPTALSKSTKQSKYSDDDDYKYTSKSTTRPKPKDDDDDDLPPYSSKVGARSSYNNDYSSSSLLKPISRLKQNDNDRPSSPSRSTARSKYNDDDDDSLLPSSKVPARSKYDDYDRPSSSLKPTVRSRFDDPAPLSKKLPVSRFDDDDDDDDKRPGSSAKTPIRSKYDDYDRSSPPMKPTVRSRFDDPAPLSKKPSVPRFDDDDDDDRRPVPFLKNSSRLRSDDDDDDYPSSSKKNNNSSRDNDYTGSGGARSRLGNNDFDSGKSGSNSARIGSASLHRSRPTINYDS